MPKAKENPRRFSDIFKRAFEVDRKEDIEDLLGKDIFIKDVAEQAGKHGNFIIVRACFPGENDDFVFVTGGVVLVKKITEAKAMNHLPLLGAITKETNYYDID